MVDPNTGGGGRWCKAGGYSGRVMAEKVVNMVSRPLVATGDCSIYKSRDEENGLIWRTSMVGDLHRYIVL
jgi:hypothetical protein